MNEDILRRNRQRKHASNPCVKCGGYTGTGYVWCHSCRAARAGTPPVKAEFPRRLPVAPLYEHVRRYVEQNAEPDPNVAGGQHIGACLEGLGLNVRRYYEWKRERSLMVSIDVADRVVTMLGLDWREVWKDYPQVMAALDAIDAVEAA